MYCSNCGTKINDNALFCMQCGKKIEINAQMSKAEVIEENQTIINNEQEENENENDNSTGYNSSDGKHAAGLIFVYDGWSKFHNNQIGIMFIEKDSVLIQFNSGGYKEIKFSDITGIEPKKLSLMIPKKFGFEIKTKDGNFKFIAGEGGRIGRFYKWNANAWVNSLNNAINNWKNER